MAEDEVEDAPYVVGRRATSHRPVPWRPSGVALEGDAAVLINTENNVVRIVGEELDNVVEGPVG
jgi:hypothetical protein